MKKLLFLMSILTIMLFTSCKKDDENPLIKNNPGIGNLVEETSIKIDGVKVFKDESGQFWGVFEDRVKYYPKSIEKESFMNYLIDGISYTFHRENIANDIKVSDSGDKLYGYIKYGKEDYEDIYIEDDIKFNLEQNCAYELPKYFYIGDEKYNIRYVDIGLESNKKYSKYYVDYIYNTLDFEKERYLYRFISSEKE